MASALQKLGNAAAASVAETPLLDRLDAIVALPDQALARHPPDFADELLTISETVMESWLNAKGRTPTRDTVEGFRLLALHRQGSRGDPSFNACRESCRELVYLTNCARLESDPTAAARHVRLAAMVARHLVLFIDGKLEDAGLGEFCCSSRPLRQRDALPGAAAQQ